MTLRLRPVRWQRMVEEKGLPSLTYGRGKFSSSPIPFAIASFQPVSTVNTQDN
jgi:hypothetical protein